MSRHVACVALALVLYGLAAPATARAQWTRLETNHFLFIGDAGQDAIRRLAVTLESFRTALSGALRADRRPPAPMVVVVFGSDRSFGPYRLRVDGRPVPAAGYFLAGDEVAYLAVDAASETRAVRAVLHEYAHVILDASAGPVPLWVAEGMAQLYETFAWIERGRTAAIGVPLTEHIALLRRRPLMPIDELLATDTASPIYNEGNRRGLFYAQSWALAHYLWFGNRERTPQLLDFLARTGAGAPAAEAFAAAFGVPAGTIESELRAYVGRRVFSAMRVEVDAAAASAVPSRGERMAEADVLAHLGDLLVRQGRGGDARARLDRALRDAPGHAGALVALARLDLREGRVEDAVVRLRDAAEAHPDDGSMHAALGAAWLEQLRREAHPARRRGAISEARAALARAVDLEPEVVHSRALLGFAEAAVGDLSRAVELLEDAVARAPARPQYRLMLADALIRLEAYDRAAAALDVAIERGGDESVRRQAREMHDELMARQRAGAAPSGDAGQAPAESVGR